MKAERRPRRFFSEQAIKDQGQKILIPAVEARHFQRTLRLKPGDTLFLTDTAGREARAAIDAYTTKGEAWVSVLEVIDRGPAREGPGIRLFVAFAAKGIMDDLVDKCQELGVEAFCPTVTGRTVVSLSAEKEEKVRQRWYKITCEAAKQSGNTRLMTVLPAEKLSTALEKFKAGEEVVFFHPGTAEVPGWGTWLEQLKSKGLPQNSKLNLFIGPEGGFSENEIEAARKIGREIGFHFSQVHLGTYLLRVPVAVMAAVCTAKMILT